MAAIQHRLDSFALNRQYDDSRACVAVYLGCADETFAAEAAYMQQAIVKTWQFSNNYINQVLSGQKDVSAWAEFEAALEAANMPYQTLINSYLTDCANKKIKPTTTWGQ